MATEAKKWTYGDAGDRFKVVAGSRWQVGPHTLVCNDLEENPYPFGTAFRPALTYTDPPWNAGNAAAFRTKNGQQGRKVDFAAFLARLCEAVKGTTGDVFIEMGKAETPLLASVVGEAGGNVARTWPITYYRTKPAVLIQAQWNGPTSWMVPDLGGKDDDHTPLIAINTCSHSGDIVFDPCTGRGLTAVSADIAGRIFHGSELNARRLAVAIDKLVKRGHTAERVS